MLWKLGGIDGDPVLRGMRIRATWEYVSSGLCLNCDRYSPNIKEIKVLDKKRVRRAKLYYLRERMNPLKN